MTEENICFRLVECEYVDEPVLLCNKETMRKLEEQVLHPCVNPVRFTINKGDD